MSLRLTLVLSLMSATAALAQVAPPPQPPIRQAANRPPAMPAPQGIATPPGAALPAGDSNATGTVAQLLLNANGDADGLLLSDGMQVAFPPHLGDVIARLLKAGDAVQVDGWRAPGVPVLRMQTLRANGQTVTDQPPVPGAALAPPRADGALSELSANGRIERLLFNDRGDVHGALLSDRTIVRFAPHVGASLTTSLQPGGPLAVRGWGTRSALGTAIEATALGTSGSDLRAVDAPPAPRPPL